MLVVIFILHLVVVSSFCFFSSFVIFLHSHFSFRHHPSPFHGLSPGFYTHFILLAQPTAEWFMTLSFSTIPLSSCCESCGFEWAFFTDRHFYLTVLHRRFNLFIKASLGGSSSSLKFAGLHTDPQNTDPAHLFVWFTVIHNLHIQNDSVLNSTIYYHELLVVKV